MYEMNIRHIFLPELVNPQPISDSIYHGPVTPEMLRALDEANETKRQHSIKLLGPKWLLHPLNTVRKNNVSV